MIKEYDHVKILKTGATGIVVDIRDTGGIFYLVELDKDNELIDCRESDIEKFN
nr:MAG TPA: NifZ domain [Caudoviricetes sp.]